MTAEITKPAKHGFTIDLIDGARRVHVRVFEFETQQVPGVGECEMPVSMDEVWACSRLGDAAGAMGRWQRELHGKMPNESEEEGGAA